MNYQDFVFLSLGKRFITHLYKKRFEKQDICKATVLHRQTCYSVIVVITIYHLIIIIQKTWKE